MTSFISKQASKLLSGVALTFALANSAQAITFDIAANGTLMGASGVMVNGTSYDVTFGDDLYGNSITAFTTLDGATAATQALIDQVLVGDYSATSSYAINGCTVASNCVINTTYGILNTRGKPAVYVYAKSERGAFTITASSLNGGAMSSTNTNIWSDSTIAKWTVSTTATAVPEPEAYAMMLAGLGLVGFAARRKKQAA